MTFPLVCPDCGAKLRIRNSVGLHELFRAEYIQCLNEACGSTFRGQREITHRLSPSGMPNPSIKLPMAPAVLRAQISSELLSQGQLDWITSTTECSDDNISE